MLRNSVLIPILLIFSFHAYAMQDPEVENPKDEDQSTEGLSDSDRDTALEFSQKELQEKFQSGAGLDLGLVMPWSKVGATFLGRLGEPISSLSLGFGYFEYSGNLDQRNYLVSGNAQASFIATRYFFLGLGPIYVEPIFGVVHWNGAIKPRGNDALTDIAASSLTSRFDIFGVDLGANLGLMWIFTNGVFLDYNFLSLNRAFFIKESYTTNTSDARKSVRSQIAGPISMSSVHLRIGYAFDF